jgi:hypothetical protein
MSIKAMGLSECLDTYTDAVSFLLTECLPPVPQFVRIHLHHFPKKIIAKPGVQEFGLSIQVHESPSSSRFRRHDLHRQFLHHFVPYISLLLRTPLLNVLKECKACPPACRRFSLLCIGYVNRYGCWGWRWSFIRLRAWVPVVIRVRKTIRRYRGQQWR